MNHFKMLTPKFEVKMVYSEGKRGSIGYVTSFGRN